jgi:hypothetical protein
MFGVRNDEQRTAAVRALKAKARVLFSTRVADAGSCPARRALVSGGALQVVRGFSINSDTSTRSLMSDWYSTCAACSVVRHDVPSRLFM